MRGLEGCEQMESYMRKILILAMLGASLSLGACATAPVVTQPGGNVGGIPASLGDTTVAQIRDAAAQACGFVPTVQTMQGLAASFFTGGALINTIVSKVEDAICAAVTKKKSARRGISGPEVNGVPIRGYFLAR